MAGLAFPRSRLVKEHLLALEVAKKFVTLLTRHRLVSALERECAAFFVVKQ